jgi:hypothetical protein
MRGVLQETFEVMECVYDVFDVARAICRLVKRMVRHHRHKAPSTYLASKHETLPRLAVLRTTPLYCELKFYTAN